MKRQFTGVHALARIADGTFGERILDNFIAPKLSKLAKCGAPPPPKMPDYYLSMILSSAFEIKLKENVRIYLLNFIRHLEIAILEYKIGVEGLQHYVSALPKTRILVFAKALANFETCIVHLYLTILFLNAIAEAHGHSPLFVTHDRSDCDRLRLLNNRIKHYDENVAESTTQTIPVTPIWITNDGFESVDGHQLSFVELVGIMGAAIQDAEYFSEELPRNLRDKKAARNKPGDMDR